MSSSIGDMALLGGARLPESTASAAELRPGQRLSADVIEVLTSGDVLLAFGQNRIVVAANQSLQVGDSIVLEVITAGTGLRIVTQDAARLPVLSLASGSSPTPDVGQPSPIDSQRSPAPLSARDLPAILQARAHLQPGGASIADAGQEFLRAAFAADLRPAVVEEIQRLLAPLNPALPAPALAAAIRTFLAQSGMFTENHLLGPQNSGAGTRGVDHQDMIPDLRLLLGELTTAGMPVPEAVRSFGEALLQQQLAVAEGLSATGVGHVVVPFMFGDEPVDVVFEWKREEPREKEKQDRPDRGISLGVFVYLKALGGIEARVDWKPEALAVTFFVEREATRALIEAGLADFSEQLTLSGCPAVTSNVWFNPGRLVTAPSPVARTIPSGTILDVMA
jgi:hypothetical protein